MEKEDEIDPTPVSEPVGEGEAIEAVTVPKPTAHPQMVMATQWGWIASGIALGVAFMALGGYYLSTL